MADDGTAWSELLAAVRDGDAAAARTLVERLLPTVVRIAHVYRPRCESVEDLCQDVFMKVFADLDQFRGQAPLDHWVARVAVYACLNRLRSERRRPKLRFADLEPAQADLLMSACRSAGPAPLDRASAARDLVERLFASLPPRDRLLIHWLQLEELSVTDVARCLVWSATRVRVQAFCARHRMRQVLKRLEAER
jgi:RNA polymerase sigma-70 factor (ECF subfamily)